MSFTTEYCLQLPEFTENRHALIFTKGKIGAGMSSSALYMAKNVSKKYR